MNQQIQESLNMLMTVIITGAISIITGVILNYINKLKAKTVAITSNVNDNSTRELLNNALLRLNSLIEDNVKSAQVTVVEEIKNNSKDGYNKDDLLAVKEIVKSNVIKQLNDDSQKLILTEINDLNEYVNNKIEIVLGELKGQLPSAN